MWSLERCTQNVYIECINILIRILDYCDLNLVPGILMKNTNSYYPWHEFVETTSERQGDLLRRFEQLSTLLCSVCKHGWLLVLCVLVRDKWHHHTTCKHRSFFSSTNTTVSSFPLQSQATFCLQPVHMYWMERWMDGNCEQWINE